MKKDKELLYEYHFKTKTPIDKDIDKNINFIKEILDGSDDIIYREFKTGGPNGRRMFLCYIDGMADKMLLNQFVLTPLMLTAREVEPDLSQIKDKLYDAAKNSGMAATDFKDTQYYEDVLLTILSGDTVLFINGYDSAFKIATKSWPARGVAEPESETVIRGPRDGFVETFRMNTALVRRRIRDPRLKVKQMQIGTRSNTDVAVMYIEGIVNPRIVEEVKSRLSKINIDAIIDSGYIQQLIEDRHKTFFPTVQTTERPDTFSASIYEGRVGIIVDNSPFALIAPATLASFLISPEDYYVRPAAAAFMRVIRIIALIFATLSPAIYISLTSFHPSMIPPQLALSIASSREGVPFPAFIEVIIMEITLELLLEAGIRLPRPIGFAISVVGGLIIGQAAVAAAIVSPIMLIVLSITAVASFSFPNYDLSNAVRFIRIILIICSSVYGLYGVVLGLIGILIHLVNIKSFGTPYLSPLAPFNKNDMKDSLFFRMPWTKMKRRPEEFAPEDLVRQGGEKDDGR